MADFYGMARTNYFKVDGTAEEIEALMAKFRLLNFTVEVTPAETSYGTKIEEDKIGKMLAYRVDQYPYFQGHIWVTDDNQEELLDLFDLEDFDDGEMEIDLVEEVGLQLAEGEVAMFGVYGHEKARYGSGHVQAVTKQDGKIHYYNCDAERHLRKVIAEEHGISEEDITFMEY